MIECSLLHSFSFSVDFSQSLAKIKCLLQWFQNFFQWISLNFDEFWKIIQCSLHSFLNFFIGSKNHLFQWISRKWNLVTVNNNQVNNGESLIRRNFLTGNITNSGFWGKLNLVWTAKSNNSTKWTMKVRQEEAYLIDKDELGFIPIKPSDKGFVIWCGCGREVKLVYNYFQKLSSNFGDLGAAAQG